MGKSILTPNQRHVLQLAAQNEEISQWFYLTGGTALSEFYLHHRLSEDLDFFTQSEINESKIDSFVEHAVHSLAGKHFKKRKYMGLYNYELLLPKGEVLKIDFNNFDFDPVERPTIHFKTLGIDSFYDIAINKMYIFTGKPRSRDYVDLFFILKTGELSLEQLLAQMTEKFSIKVDSFFMSSQFLQVKDATDLPTMLVPFDPKEMEEFFLKLAKSLEDEIFA